VKIHPAQSGHRTHRARACALITAALLAACAQESTDLVPAKADAVFASGRIYTVDAERNWAEAVAIRDGRIIFVGSNADAQDYIGPGTSVTDLHGHMMLPGIQDVHIHPIEAGIEAAQCSLSGLNSIADYQQAVAACADANRESPWIVGSGWNFLVFGAGATPDRKTLDEVVADRPVYISSYDEHAGWANSRALQIAGITKDTPDPPGGQIIRDPATGEPTGALQEEARHLVKKFMPPVTAQEKVAALRSSVRILNAWGITGIQDASVEGEEELRVYKTLEVSGELSLRVVAAMSWYPNEGMEQLETLIALRQRYSSALIDASTVKIWQDGVMENYTAAMLEPYRIASGSRGEPLIDPQELKRIVTRLDAEGFQVEIHAIGDAAVRQSLDAMEQALTENGQRGNRHHIAHLQMIDPADIPRFGALGVIANFQPLWAFADEYVTDINIPSIGEERARWMYPIRSVRDAGGMIAFGSDWSVTTANPFPQMETAITRQSAIDDSYPVFNPEERLDLATAIDAFTINAAFVNKRESTTGSIEVGKFADLIVVDQNLFEIEARNISETRVLLTLFNGKVVAGSIDDV
jgi:predicted amidohydrolase YtcJ